MNSNRELLIEFCTAHSIAVANTFFDLPLEELVTFRRQGVPPMADVSFSKFAQLDFLLVQQCFQSKVIDVRSIRKEALASHHFLLSACVRESLDVQQDSRRPPGWSTQSLRHACTANDFVSQFVDYIEKKDKTAKEGDCFGDSPTPESVLTLSGTPESQTPRSAKDAERIGVTATPRGVTGESPAPSKYIDPAVVRHTDWRSSSHLSSHHTAHTAHTTVALGANIENVSDMIVSAFTAAANNCLASKPLPSPKKPWIRAGTLDLIQQRSRARAACDYETERSLHRQIKKASRVDRRIWLSNLAATGTWSAIKQLCKPAVPQQGRLKSADGELCDSEDRADTLARYLQDVQWARKDAQLSSKVALHDELPVRTDCFCMRELLRAAHHLKDNKAVGSDEIPVEFWKGVLKHRAGSNDAAQMLLSFCNECWKQKDVPNSWHLQNVKMLFKKGEPADCGNYRPVCLLNSAYKVFAVMLLNRLLDAHVDLKVASSQFGFKPGTGTIDALHCARRAIEVAWSQRFGQLHMLALDWRKAFDSINVESMLEALKRFGLPLDFINMVRAIYRDRVFQVRDCGQSSSQRNQGSGIVQGCPLSPFLFIIVMTVLMHDAYERLSEGAQLAVTEGRLYDLLYAGDTLLLGTSAKFVGELAAAVEHVGGQFGMHLHWGKTQALSIGSNDHICNSTGQQIPKSESIVYLGGLLCSDARMDSELSRRIGMANSVFLSLRTVWSHTSISTKAKLAFFRSLVVSRLLYGLSSCWLVKRQMSRLEGFYARCLRSILRIPVSYVSRVSNNEVFRRARMQPLGAQLRAAQCVLLGKTAQSGPGSLLRKNVFMDGTLSPVVGHYIRRVGRPRQDWTNGLLDWGAQQFRSRDTFKQMLMTKVPQEWSKR